MSEPERNVELAAELASQQQRIHELEQQLLKKDKINAVLMKRVEKGFDSQGDAFSLFHAASSLEIEVRERTQALEKAMRDLSTTNARLESALQELEASQIRLVQSEKLAALGQLIAGIAHEINTPLGAVRASIGNMTGEIDDILSCQLTAIRQFTPEEFGFFTTLIARAHITLSGLSSRESRQARKRIAEHFSTSGIDNADKIAEALVDIGATDAFEELTPHFARANSACVLQAAMRFLNVKLNSTNIELAVQKASKVIFALKSYVHHEVSGSKTALDINASIDTVLTLYDNQIKQGVRVFREFGSLPLLWCHGDELSQVWTNLIFNALQAMNNHGELRIRTRPCDNRIEVSITDSGPGIPDAIKDRIFDSFFTTKRAGEGTGLGLSIVRDIINKHAGSISVDSHPGQTTFNISLPLQPTTP